MATLLMRVLTWFAASMVTKVLMSAGIGVFSFFFLNRLFSDFLDQFLVAVNSFPATVLMLLANFGFDVYLSTILSALTVITYLKSMSFILTRI